MLIKKKVKEYIMGYDKEPFIINGESGSGKTSIIAKIANEVC